ncbi:MAG: HD domain-containing protein [Gammaproteobacteria bacterium]|nr:HD domain-containing protein [Gammaproteobacteria bacterium]
MNAAPGNPRAVSPVAIAVVALLLLIGLGALLINVYIEGERQRDLLQWESRLGLVADAKADAVARLLAADRRALQELAANASLQLYLWQVTQARQSPEPGSEPAQQAYLRNLVLAAGERGGYLPDAGARIPANLPQSPTSGLALLDASLTPVAVTPGLGSVEVTYREVARRALAAPSRPVVDLVLDAEDRAMLVVAVPVNLVSGARVPGPVQPGGGPAGVVLGVRSAAQELFPLLGRGPSFAEDSETLLLARRDDSVVFLSPTREGANALRRSMPLDRPEADAQLAEVVAVLSPDGFASLDNYRGTPVLQVSRRIRGQALRSEARTGNEWVLVQQVQATEALSGANERRTFLLATLSLLLVAIAALAVAAWRHGSSVRAGQQAAELRDKAAKLQRQTDLLHTITDNVDVLTVLINRDQEVVFTNQATATAVRSSIAGLVGGPLAGIFGHGTAALLASLSEEVRRQRTSVHRVLPLTLGGGLRSYQTSLIPVARIGERRQLVLLVLSDVTELKVVEQRHADLLRDLVSTLSDVVALHDPFSAHHAKRMAEVAQAVARELGLPDAERETLGLAATLANIGKIMLPSELLTKTEPLTTADRELLRKHVDYSLQLLKGLDFEGHVLEAIAQKQELLDGSGYPRGLTQQQMTLSGRILSVANAFVALVSVRAYRQGFSIEAALEELLRNAGTQYDRRVIAALFHVAENRRDWSQWAAGTEAL